LLSASGSPFSLALFSNARPDLPMPLLLPASLNLVQQRLRQRVLTKYLEITSRLLGTAAPWNHGRHCRVAQTKLQGDLRE
jgi:hypothetical protein